MQGYQTTGCWQPWLHSLRLLQICCELGNSTAGNRSERRFLSFHTCWLIMRTKWMVSWLHADHKKLRLANHGRQTCWQHVWKIIRYPGHGVIGAGIIVDSDCFVCRILISLLGDFMARSVLSFNIMIFSCIYRYIFVLYYILCTEAR